MTKTIKYFCCSLVMLGSLSLSGCNTVAGFGEDLSSGGKAITHAADKNK